MLIYLIVCIITFGFTTFLTIAGLGAAFILIPILLALGVPLLTAMSTALLLNSVAMVIASLNYMREKLIVFKIAIPIALVATVFSPIGARTAEHLPETTLKWIFVCFLLFAASMIIFFKPKEKQQGKQQEQQQKEDSNGKDGIVNIQLDEVSATQTEQKNTTEGELEIGAQETLPENETKKLVGYGIIVGTVAGFLGGLLGVGGGNFIVPFLIFLGFNAKNAAATTAFIVIFSSLSGFFAHMSLGNFDLWLLLFCAVGSISGAILGSYLMKKKMSAKQVKIAIGIVLYIVAAKMIFDLLSRALAA